MIRGGARVSLPAGLSHVFIKDAVNRMLSAHPRDPLPYTTLADTTDEAILGGLVRVDEDDKVGRFLLAADRIPKNTAVMPVDGVVLEKRNTWSIQVAKQHHLFALGGSQLCAHSCQPNMHLLFDYGGDKTYRGSDAVQETLPALWYTSRRDIEKGERLSFDYNTSEWVVSDSFVDVNTKIPVEGFSKITDPAYRLRVLPYITPPVRQQALEEGLLTEEEAEIAGIFAKTIDA